MLSDVISVMAQPEGVGAFEKFCKYKKRYIGERISPADPKKKNHPMAVRPNPPKADLFRV